MTLVTPYWDWIRSEAALIDTDGCSAVSGLTIECCFEHDLGYYHARDPRDAYRKALDPDVAPDEHWLHAKPIDREEVDRRFRSCHQNHSRLGRWSLMATWRWLGVRVGAQGAWDKHRAREEAQRVREASV